MKKIFLTIVVLALYSVTPAQVVVPDLAASQKALKKRLSKDAFYLTNVKIKGCTVSMESVESSSQGSSGRAGPVGTQSYEEASSNFSAGPDTVLPSIRLNRYELDFTKLDVERITVRPLISRMGLTRTAGPIIKDSSMIFIGDQPGGAVIVKKPNEIRERFFPNTYSIALKSKLVDKTLDDFRNLAKACRK